MTNKFRRTILTGLAIFSLFDGCGIFDSDVEEDVVQPNHIIPLLVGNLWEYQSVSTDTNYNSGNSDPTIMEVQRLSEWGTFEGYQISNLIVNPFFPSTPLLINYNDGLYSASGERTIPATDPIIDIVIPYPTQVGDSLSSLGYVVRTISVSHEISVPAGDFECIYYEIEKNGELYGKLWCTPGVGFIKTWHKFWLSDLSYELLSFRNEP